MVASEIIELKKKLISLLKEDEEFRLVVVGLIGYSEVLKRLDRHEEEMRRVWESIEKLREDFLIFVKEQEKRWEENNRRWEENSRRWEETYKRFEVIENELKRLREDFNRAFESLSRRVDALGARLGIIAEGSFREGMRGVVEEVFGVGEVRRWVYYDDKGEVLGYPSVIEVDLLIRDRTHVLVEVKASTSDSDVSKLWRVGKLYERVVGIKPELVIITPFIDRGGLRTAKELGVKVYTKT